MNPPAPPRSGLLVHLDRLLPGWVREADSETRVRGRLLVLLVGSVALLGASSSLAEAAQGHVGRALIWTGCSGAAVLCLAIPFWSGRLRSATWSSCAVLFLALIVPALLAGEQTRPPIGAAILPVLATALAGPKVGLVWTAIVVSTLGVLALTTIGDVTLAGILWQTAMLSTALGLGAALFERVRAKTRHEARDSLERRDRDHRDEDRATAEGETIQELFTAVFSQAPAVLLLSDFESGQIQDVNESFERLLGWSLEEAQGRTFTELNGWSSPNDRDLLSERLLRDGLSKDVEIPFRNRSGDTLWLLVTASRIEIQGRSHLLAQGIDITQRKRAERALEETQRQLEERVSRRTEQLRESRMELRRQHQLATLGTLAAGIAHQINNPIASIKAAAEYALLASDATDSSLVRTQALRTAISEAERCGRIVQNVLRFSRREPTAKWAEDLNEIVQRAATLTRPYVEGAGGSLALRVQAAPLPARISPIEIEQAIVHLLRNAAEALEGGGRIQLSTRRREDVAEIEIVDDGRGIPPEDRERVLQPFYTTRLALGGTGLGLPFVHDVIREHGGELQIESTSEKGTRIRVQLPLV